MARMKTVADLLRWEPYLREDAAQRLTEVRCPERFKGQDVPRDLNSLTLEALARLWAIKDTRTLFMSAGAALFGLSEEETLRSPLMPMLGIANMVARELPKVADRWDSAAGEPSAEELQAGSKELDFGVFGLADWYARRMGMKDHDEAFATPWLRIWQCAYNDNQVRQFERRLQEVQKQRFQNR